MAVNKVLVVDDSPVDLANLESIVTGAGCRVVTASNGKEALELARSEKPDVIFLDIIMPDMDGYEACRKLASDADTRAIPIVFVTSKDQKADRIWAKMQGGRELIAKPYTTADIVAQLDSI